MTYGTKWPEYARQWDAMVINSSRDEEFRRLALKFIDLKPRYVPLSQQTGIPWQIFAVMHMRESDNDFSKSLAQGDPWNQRSTNEPISGPFSSFEESAIWTMNHDGLTQVVDWRLEKQLWHLERLNGLGYSLGPTDNRTGIKYPPMPSPYIWGGTNQQRPGKYIRDHVFDPNTMDTQPGCAAILWMMAKLDPTIEFVRETPMGVEPPAIGKPPMATTDADLQTLVGAVENLTKAVGTIRLEVSTLRSLVTGEPVKTADPAKADSVVTTPSATPIADTLQSTSMQISSVAGVAIWIAQALGVLPPGIGEAATQLGAVLSAAPVGSGLISATGAWGGIQTLFNRITGRKPA